jgi:hypothetical protein
MELNNPKNCVNYLYHLPCMHTLCVCRVYPVCVPLCVYLVCIPCVCTMCIQLLWHQTFRYDRLLQVSCAYLVAIASADGIKWYLDAFLKVKCPQQFMTQLLCVKPILDTKKSSKRTTLSFCMGQSPKVACPK